MLGIQFFNFETHLLEFWSEYLKASYSFVLFPPQGQGILHGFSYNGLQNTEKMYKE